ncbi:HofP DNA utilization family protein [Enterobacter asburiae]|uniref:HofP DNA utilization family protein n=1 Tax=unclassified Scandinavium TaxID=2830652 RepID=UPI00289D071D|nr:HofP DNA utilization family protein [Scandinavium sp.]
MTDRHGLIVLLLPLLLGMRDPFLPAEDRCSSAQITLWHYRGMVSLGEQRTGIVLDASGKWQRLTQGQTLSNGWTVVAVQPDRMDMTAGTDCEPSQWRWIKEGTQHDSKDSVGVNNDGLRRPGQRKNRLADGG